MTIFINYFVVGQYYGFKLLTSCAKLLSTRVMSERSEIPGSPLERRTRPPLQMVIETRANPDHPERNEDAIFVDEQTRVAIILDGVGGLAAGDKASRVAGAFILKCLAGITEDTHPEPVGRILRQTLIEAAQQVRQEVPGGATTATAVKLVKGGNKGFEAVIAHVGDSRAYILRGYGEGLLKQVTEDDLHIYEGLATKQRRKLQEQFDRITNEQLLGKFQDRIRGRALSREEQRLFRRRNQFSQVLGEMSNPARLNPHLYYPHLDPARDVLFLTTDGIHDNLTRDEVEAIVRNTGISLIAQKLVSESYRKSLQDIRESSGQLTRSHHDDMSVVLIKAA